MKNTRQITPSEFARLSPSLLWMSTTPECPNTTKNSNASSINCNIQTNQSNAYWERDLYNFPNLANLSIRIHERILVRLTRHIRYLVGLILCHIRRGQTEQVKIRQRLHATHATSLSYWHAARRCFSAYHSLGTGLGRKKCRGSARSRGVSHMENGGASSQLV